MNVPKRQYTTYKNTNKLSSICNAKMIFKNYRNDLDIIEVYEFIGFYGAIISPEIKSNFNYDYMLNNTKNEYKDSFNRAVTVKKLENEII